ncbi:hypothetical protein B5M09_013236 [Aphanomyces astaci]|uniref:Uncharacterized protein n=1 Tax=Aphanomyces astaci TaxID=112090 RepID=A0A425CTG8_APHAT|nr:hypothetical protein B5M09_013236 [Aphanomyces astaci]
MRALDRHDQAWVLDQEGKTVVDIMVKVIKPLGLKVDRQVQFKLVTLDTPLALRGLVLQRNRAADQLGCGGTAGFL